MIGRPATRHGRGFRDESASGGDARWWMHNLLLQNDKGKIAFVFKSKSRSSLNGFCIFGFAFFYVETLCGCSANEQYGNCFFERSIFQVV
jgi:hypothetical protein